MSDTSDLRTRLVPAICTQCGASLEVDPSQDAAVCKYCNTPFIVEKAIRNYSIQNAKIDHVENVNIDMKGTADSFFSFLGKQMSERREMRREERAAQREESRVIQMGFLKIMGILFIGMFALAAIMILVQAIRGDFGGEEPSESTEALAEDTAYVSDGGTFYVEDLAGEGRLPYSYSFDL